MGWQLVVLPPEYPLLLLSLFGCLSSSFVPFGAAFWAVLSVPLCTTLLVGLARYPRRGEGRVPPPPLFPCSTLFESVEGVVVGCWELSSVVAVGL